MLRLNYESSQRFFLLLLAPVFECVNLSYFEQKEAETASLIEDDRFDVGVDSQPLLGTQEVWPQQKTYS